MICVFFVNVESLLFSDNLEIFFQKQRHSDPIVFHNFNATAEKSGDINFSSVVILSRSAASLIIDDSVKFISCVESKWHTLHVDTILLECLDEFKVANQHIPEIHSQDLTASDNWPADPCTRPLSFSKVHASTISYLCGNGSCRSNATYANMFNAVKVPGANILRTSPKSISVWINSVEGCRKECDTKKECLSWSFDGANHCLINSDLGTTSFRKGSFSGVCNGRYVCGTPSTSCRVPVVIHNEASIISNPAGTSPKSKTERRNSRSSRR